MRMLRWMCDCTEKKKTKYEVIIQVMFGVAPIKEK